ncbi:MAG: hypothetical protein ABJ251_12350 [Paracoccaceae bacterium]
MADWFSEDAVGRFRHTIRTFKRFHGLSNARLSTLLGDQRLGPSASTLARFLEESGLGGELSLRHAREVRNNLQRYIAENSESSDTAAFIQSCRDELAFFEFNNIHSQPADAKRADLQGKFILARRLPSLEFLFSLMIFSKDRPFECVAHKLSTQGSQISMKCQVRSINSTVYLEGQNPVNNSIRFMCFSRYGPDSNILTGIMAGFEAHASPFAARALLVKVGHNLDAKPEIDEIAERNGFEEARRLFSEIAIDQGQALAAIETCVDAGYLISGSMQI